MDEQLHQVAPLRTREEAAAYHPLPTLRPREAECWEPMKGGTREGRFGVETTPRRGDSNKGTRTEERGEEQDRRISLSSIAPSSQHRGKGQTGAIRPRIYLHTYNTCLNVQNTAPRRSAGRAVVTRGRE